MNVAMIFEAFLWSAFDLFDWMDYPILPEAIVRWDIDVLFDESIERVAARMNRRSYKWTDITKIALPEGMGFSYKTIQEEPEYQI